MPGHKITTRIQLLSLPATALVAAALLAPGVAGNATAAQKGRTMLQSGGAAMMMPVMDPAKGRKLFASRGCVLCHSVNGVGGSTGPSFDVTGTPSNINPFTFAARMWRGAEAMIALQSEDLGYQIDVDGEELGHISAFAYDRAQQKKFSVRDVPRSVLKLMKDRNL